MNNATSNQISLIFILVAYILCGKALLDRVPPCLVFDIRSLNSTYSLPQETFFIMTSPHSI